MKNKGKTLAQVLIEKGDPFRDVKPVKSGKHGDTMRAILQGALNALNGVSKGVKKTNRVKIVLDK